jgi:hypothetical protein
MDMQGTSLKAALFSAFAFATMAGFGTAHAGPTVIFDSLGDTPVIHPEGVNLFAGGTEAASFTSTVTGDAQSLTLDLNCSGQNGDAKCASGTYSDAQQVQFKTGATAGSNKLTLNSVTGVTVGSFIQGGGANGIAGGTIWVTAINGNTLTLSKALTATQASTLNSNGTSGRAVLFLPQGSFTVNLYGKTTTGIPGSSASSTSIPTGSPLASFTVYDAALYVQNNALTNLNPNFVAYTYTMPFGGLSLKKGTSYWLDLTNLSPGDPTNSGVGWEFLTDSNQAHNVGVKNEYWYVKNYTCSNKPCSQINGGSTDTIVDGVFGMELTVPEPGALAILGTALAAVGLIRRRALA